MKRPSGFFRLRPLELDLGDVLVQVVAVALGVILGLAATSWNERKHERALLQETVGNIVAELSENQKGMRPVMAGHAKSEAVLTRLVLRSVGSRSISAAEGAKALRAIGPLHENVPLDIAWQIAQQDQGLRLLPYQDRYDLAGVYQVQAIYYRQEERFGNSMLTLTDPPNGNYFLEIVDLANQLKSVVAIENQLDGLYTKAIQRAKSEFNV